MTRSTPTRNSFTAGELTPAVQERTDLAAYSNGCRYMRNFVSLPWGGATTRPGRVHAAEAKHADKLARLLEFEFNTEQTYALEFGDRYMRFFRNRGQATVLTRVPEAAVSNPNFANDLSGWDDLSTGSAFVEHVFIETPVTSTMEVAQTSFLGVGDGVPSQKFSGFRFRAPGSGPIQRVEWAIHSVPVVSTFRAYIYTNSLADMPSIQVGEVSNDTLIEVAGIQYFTWTTPPVLDDDSVYWVIFEGVEPTSHVEASIVPGQGGDFGTGTRDIITDIPVAGTIDFRVRIYLSSETSDGAAALVGNGGDVAILEYEIAAPGDFFMQEHVLKIQISGIPGDTVFLKIDLLGTAFKEPEFELAVGFHTVTYDATTVHSIRFRNEANKTVYLSHVELLGAGAVEPAALEIGTPYRESQLRGVKYVGTADVIYMVSPDHQIHKLGRLSNTNWSLTELDLTDGPYLDENGDNAKTLTPSAVANGIVTAVGHAPFQKSDIGRLVRIKIGPDWGAGRIIEFLSITQVRVLQLPGLNYGGMSASAAWQLGLYSDTTGYPRAVTLYEQRLFFAGNRERPSRIDGSRSLGEYEDFTPGAEDNDAVAYNIGSNQVNAIRWMGSTRALLPGTSNAEFRLSGSSTQAALTSTNVIARSETKEGVADIRPIAVSDVVLFVQRQGKQLHELAFSFEVGSDGGFVSPDISILGQHLLEGEVVDICFQKTPWSIVWMCLKDGRLIGMTYQRSQQVIALHYHPFSDDTAVEAVASIPGEGNDELWLVVRRTINGQVRRCVEYLADPLLREGRPEDAFHVDAGLSLDNSIDASLTLSAKFGTNVQFTAGAEVFAPEDVGRRIQYRYSTRDALGNLEWLRVGATIKAYVSPSVVTADIIFFPVLSIPAGDWQLTVTSVSGLEHLEGATVRVVGDGAVQSDKVVTGGAIDLDTPAAVVHVGLPYQCTLVPTRPLAGAERGSSQGQKKRIASVIVSFDRSGAAKVGRSLERLESIAHRDVGDLMDTAVPLFTGAKKVPFPGDYDNEGDVYVVQDLPLPCTVLAIYPDMEVNEG